MRAIICFTAVAIASRFLDLQAFGTYSLAWAVTVIANTFVFTGFYQALLRSTEFERDRDSLFWLMAAVGRGGRDLGIGSCLPATVHAPSAGRSARWRRSRF
ncbi:MAG: oligosaccharide flippase family protein [Paracoccaceae bacterium]